MADKKITELTEVTSLPDAAFLTAVDTTRATGDQNVKIQKSNLDTSISGGELEYQTEITTSTTLTTQKGLNKVYPVNSASDVVITVPQGVYSENDVINFQKKGSGSIEFVPNSGARIRGKRDRNNRYFINDSRGIVALLCEGGDIFSIIGNLTTGYTGAVTTTSYSSLVDGDTGVDVQVIGSGFSSNMLVSVSSNATLNSFTVNSNTSLTLNMDAVGGVGDTVSITYDNGDEFIDVNAITISDSAAPIANIVSYWKFNNNATDSVGTNNATNNGVTFTTGKISDSGVFDGTLDNFTVADDSTLTFGNGTTDTPFSATMWLKFNTATGNSILFEKIRSANSEFEYLFFHNGANFIVQFYSQGSQNNRLAAEGAFTPTLSQWYHIAFTYDGSGNFTGIDLRVDNTSLTLSNVSVGSYIAMQADGSPLYIGARPSQSGIGLDGEMDDLVFWNKELNNSELTSIYDIGNSGNPLL